MDGFAGFVGVFGIVCCIIFSMKFYSEGSKFGTREGIAKTRQEAVIAGVGEWKANEKGEAVFTWKVSNAN